MSEFPGLVRLYHLHYARQLGLLTGSLSARERRRNQFAVLLFLAADEPLPSPISIRSLQEAKLDTSAASDAGPNDLWSCPKCGGPMMVVERLTASEIHHKKKRI